MFFSLFLFQYILLSATLHWLGSDYYCAMKPPWIKIQPDTFSDFGGSRLNTRRRSIYKKRDLYEVWWERRGITVSFYLIGCRMTILFRTKSFYNLAVSGSLIDLCYCSWQSQHQQDNWTIYCFYSPSQKLVMEIIFS